MWGADRERQQGKTLNSGHPSVLHFSSLPFSCAGLLNVIVGSALRGESQSPADVPRFSGEYLGASFGGSVGRPRLAHAELDHLIPGITTLELTFSSSPAPPVHLPSPGVSSLDA